MARVGCHRRVKRRLDARTQARPDGCSRDTTLSAALRPRRRHRASSQGWDLISSVSPVSVVALAGERQRGGQAEGRLETTAAEKRTGVVADADRRETGSDLARGGGRTG